MFMLGIYNTPLSSTSNIVLDFGVNFNRKLFFMRILSQHIVKH
jgi:hypothetical protein